MYRFLFFILFCFSFFVFAQENQAPDTEVFTDAVTGGYKKALQLIDQEKKEKEEQIYKKLTPQIEDWLNQQQSAKKEKVNYRIEDVWDRPSKASSECPLCEAKDYSARYYLRDASYIIKNKEMERAESVSYPYRAVINVREELYLDQSPLVTRPRLRYHYTVETDIKLTFQYNEEEDKWSSFDIKRSLFCLKKGWPQNIEEKLIDIFIPRD